VVVREAWAGEKKGLQPLGCVMADNCCSPVAISMGHGGIAEEIAKLNYLKEQGVLSSMEFEVAKAKVLGNHED